MILAGNAPEQEVFVEHTESANQYGSDEERAPVIDAQQVKQNHGDQGTEHVHGAMGEVDDLQQTEDNREAKA